MAGHMLPLAMTQELAVIPVVDLGQEVGGNDRFGSTGRHNAMILSLLYSAKTGQGH